MRSDWIRFPMSILHLRGIKPIDAVICALLYDLADYNDGIYYVRVRHKYIAETLGVSVDTVKRSLKILCDYGIIQKERTGRANMYFLDNDILPPKQKNKGV